jgi:hypothetical protein
MSLLSLISIMALGDTRYLSHRQDRLCAVVVAAPHRVMAFKSSAKSILSLISHGSWPDFDFSLLWSYIFSYSFSSSYLSSMTIEDH